MVTTTLPFVHQTLSFCFFLYFVILWDRICNYLSHETGSVVACEHMIPTGRIHHFLLINFLKLRMKKIK